MNPDLPSNMFVDADGNDDFGDGSMDNPYATIQAAVNALEDNEEITHIIIDDGIYNENIEITQSIVLTSFYMFDGDTSHIFNTIIDGAPSEDGELDIYGSCILIHPPIDADASREEIIVEVDGLTMINGYGTQLEVFDDPNTPEDETELFDSSTFWAGGAICAVNVELIITNNIFSFSFWERFVC